MINRCRLSDLFFINSFYLYHTEMIFCNLVHCVRGDEDFELCSVSFVSKLWSCGPLFVNHFSYMLALPLIIVYRWFKKKKRLFFSVSKKQIEQLINMLVWEKKMLNRMEKRYVFFLVKHERRDKVATFLFSNLFIYYF